MRQLELHYTLRPEGDPWWATSAVVHANRATPCRASRDSRHTHWCKGTSDSRFGGGDDPELSWSKDLPANLKGENTDDRGEGEYSNSLDHYHLCSFHFLGANSDGSSSTSVNSETLTDFASFGGVNVKSPEPASGLAFQSLTSIVYCGPPSTSLVVIV